MRCFVENNAIIKLRKENIFLCFDGNEWSPFWERLFRFLNVQCPRFDIHLKMGLLSWEKTFEAPPNAEFLAKHAMTKRGRFLTPLVEKIFPALEQKTYKLCIFSSGGIHDLEDWREDLDAWFHDISVFDPEELKQKNQIALEEFCLQKIIGENIRTFSLSSKNALFHDFPESCSLSVSVEEGTCLLTQEYNTPLADIPIKLCGTLEKATLWIETNNLAGEFHIRNTEPDFLTFENKLNQAERELFFTLFDNYKNGDFHHYCPICKKEHGFTSKAFLCSRQKSAAGGVFARDTLIFNSIEALRRTELRYVLFWQKQEDEIFWLLMEKPVLCLDNMGAVVITERDVFYVKCSDTLHFFPLKRIHKGLFHDEAMKLSILTMT